MKPYPIAILTSDWHMSHKPPIARSVEPDWYETMGRVINQVGSLSKRHKDIPILLAGDLLHTWNEPSELINWLIKNLPKKIYTIPGQHDLPLHNLKDIHRSGYHTLALAGAITDVRGSVEIKSRGKKIEVTGFPFGTPLKTCSREKNLIKVALVHQYIWISGTQFMGASKKNHVTRLQDKLGTNYDTIVVGDNHIGFKFQNIFNCGSLMRRNIDQKGYNPAVGILYSDGVITKFHLDVHKDKWVSQKKLDNILKREIDLKELIKDFKNLSHSSFNFLEQLEKLLKSDKIDPDVKTKLIEIMDKVKK